MSIESVTIKDCKFGVHLEADATAVAQSIADAVAELARANNTAAQALVRLAECLEISLASAEVGRDNH